MKKTTDKTDGCSSKKFGFILSPSKIRRLELKRTKAKKGKNSELDRRLRAIILVATGTTEEQAALMVEISHRAIQYWISSYRENGVDGLKKGPYPGKKPAITPEQKAKLKKIIKGGPEKYGLDTGVWTAPVVGMVIEKEFGVTYCCSQIRRILHSLNFTMQYPKQVLSKADKELQRIWLEKTFPKIKKKPKGKVE